MVRARIVVTPKPGVLDPEAKAIENALVRLGFAGVRDLRQGKFIELTVDEADRERAVAEVEAMCARLLANPVIETFRIELE